MFLIYLKFLIRKQIIYQDTIEEDIQEGKFCWRGWKQEKKGWSGHMLMKAMTYMKDAWGGKGQGEYNMGDRNKKCNPHKKKKG